MKWNKIMFCLLYGEYRQLEIVLLAKYIHLLVVLRIIENLKWTD
jgi:hypothetical protein